MKSLISNILLLNSFTLTNAFDNFQDIPVVGEEPGENHDPNIIENSNKTVNVELKRGVPYREIVKEAVYKHHLMV